MYIDVLYMQCYGAMIKWFCFRFVNNFDALGQLSFVNLEMYDLWGFPFLNSFFRYFRDFFFLMILYCVVYICMILLGSVNSINTKLQVGVVDLKCLFSYVVSLLGLFNLFSHCFISVFTCCVILLLLSQCQITGCMERIVWDIQFFQIYFNKITLKYLCHWHFFKSH